MVKASCQQTLVTGVPHTHDPHGGRKELEPSSCSLISRPQCDTKHPQLHKIIKKKRIPRVREEKQLEEGDFEETERKEGIEWGRRANTELTCLGSGSGKG